MIPYFPEAWTRLALGPFTLHVFGLAVAVGVFVMYFVFTAQARRLGVGPPRAVEMFMLWMVVGGFVGAHVLDTVFYHPQVLRQRPLELLMIHHGLSSYGGLVGTVVAGLLYLRIRKLDPWPFVDAWCYAFPTGWFFGRMGCTMVHDHPGRLSRSLLAVRFPDGPRFDLGLFEFALTPLLMLVVVLVARRTRRPGAVSGALALSYAVMRFPLDALRATDLGRDLSDPRYGGLTPAQWASFALLGTAAWLLHHAWRHPATGDAVSGTAA